MCRERVTPVEVCPTVTKCFGRSGMVRDHRSRSENRPNFLDTEEVTGSIPVSPTIGKGQVTVWCLAFSRGLGEKVMCHLCVTGIGSFLQEPFGVAAVVAAPKQPRRLVEGVA
jgi:hypothetical protein